MSNFLNVSRFLKFFYLCSSHFSFVDGEDSTFLFFHREAWVDFELVGDDVLVNLDQSSEPLPPIQYWTILDEFIIEPVQYLDSSIYFVLSTTNKG